MVFVYNQSCELIIWCNSRSLQVANLELLELTLGALLMTQFILVEKGKLLQRFSLDKNNLAKIFSRFHSSFLTFTRFLSLSSMRHSKYEVGSSLSWHVFPA